jgi:hypothetical protein
VLPKSLAAELQTLGDFESIAFPPLRNSIPVSLVIPDRDSSFPLAEAFFQLATSEKRPLADRRSKRPLWVNGSGHRSGQISSSQAHTASS